MAHRVTIIGSPAAVQTCAEMTGLKTESDVVGHAVRIMAMNGSSTNVLMRRPATPADVPFLVELRRATMAPHQIASGVVPSEEDLLHRVMARFECAEITLLADQPVGLVKVARDGLDWELIQIQVMPRLQGRGFGTQLIRDVIAEARRAGATLRLNVLKVNPARRLYERLDFSVIADKPRAVVMQLAR